MIAILCAARKSIYKSMSGVDVDVYDIDRDARTFAGGMPIVAHPPCRAWSAFCAHQSRPLPGEKDLAPLCVEWLRKCGGVLEHPAYSRLWDELGLPKPNEPSRDGFFSIAVKQSWFGDSRSKGTWILICTRGPVFVPPIPFRLHNPSGDRQRWKRMSKHQRAATPPEFAEWLVSLARSCEVAI